MADASALARLARAALDSDRLAAGLSARASALLGRQALETAVEAVLDVAPSASMRARLLCLVHADPRSGGQASHLWWSLTRACHQDSYERAPARADVRRLVEETQTWIAAATTASD